MIVECGSVVMICECSCVSGPVSYMAETFETEKVGGLSCRRAVEAPRLACAVTCCGLRHRSRSDLMVHLRFLRTCED